MGQRRKGFLTRWQLDYIHGSVEPLSKTRQRVEDFYIMGSLDATFKQLQLIQFWLMHKQVRSLYYSETTVKVVQRAFEEVRGRKGNRKYHDYTLNILCPHCRETFRAKFSINDKKDICWQNSTFGIKKQPEIDYQI